MLSCSTEHEITNAYKTKMLKNLKPFLEMSMVAPCMVDCLTQDGGVAGSSLTQYLDCLPLYNLQFFYCHICPYNEAH